MMQKTNHTGRVDIEQGSHVDKNAIFENQLIQKENEQASLLCVAGRIAAVRSRADLWDIINNEILDLFNSQYYTLCLLSEDATTHYPFLHSRDKKLENGKVDSPIIHRQHPVNDGVFNLALSADQPVIFQLAALTQQKDIAPYVHYWFKLGIKEMMLVKITNANEDRGVLFLYSNKEGAFSSEKFNLLAGVADLLGTGMCNVLANEKIEQQMEEIDRYRQQLEEEKAYLIAEQSANRFSGFIGHSPEIQKIFRLISQVAPSDATVLLLGETGTGKELVARAIHEASPRRGKLMIKVNCAALPANLIESELFGHEKGSFTGASDRRIGKFELANNSTLFLDEIGELPPELQVKLLRALQEKEIERVGGGKTISVNVRIIAATNRNLEKEVSQNRFRSDLYYRLNVFPITLPPLRKRKEDIPALTSYFIERFSRNSGKKISGISQKAMEKLISYAWPGNIRELEHLIERAVLLTNKSIIKMIQLPEQIGAESSLSDKAFQILPLEEIEREYILKVLKICRGRISGPSGAATKLKMPATTLISKMQRLGIKKEHFVTGKEDGEV